MRIFRVFTETNLLLKVSEMYSSDKKRTKKEKPRVTKTKNDRSYIKNAEVLLKKKHCLDRHYTTLHQKSSTVEKTNYLEAHGEQIYFLHKDTSDRTHNYFHPSNFPFICSHGRFLSKCSVTTMLFKILHTKLTTLSSKDKGVSQPQELRTQQEF